MCCPEMLIKKYLSNYDGLVFIYLGIINWSVVDHAQLKIIVRANVCDDFSV